MRSERKGSIRSAPMPIGRVAHGVFAVIGDVKGKPRLFPHGVHKALRQLLWQPMHFKLNGLTSV